jgi:hypothetical protein
MSQLALHIVELATGESLSPKDSKGSNEDKRKDKKKQPGRVTGKQP